MSSHPKKLLIDRLLQRYVDFIASPVRQDHLIKLAQYLLWFLARVYGKDTLQALSYELLYTRYANRLLGFPAALEAARNGSWTSSSQKYPKLFRYLGQILAWSMVCYYPAEHIAYLQWKVPKWSKTHRSAEKWSAWSCRCWVIYIVTEMVQNIAQLRECRSRLIKAEKDGEDRTQLQRTQRNIFLQLSRNVLYILPAIQFSLPNWDQQPWLNVDLVNGLFLGEAIVSVAQSILNLS